MADNPKQQTPEELTPSYYFSDPLSFRFPEIFDGVEFVPDAFLKSKKLFEDFTKDEVRDLFGLLREHVTIAGHFSIEDGTEIGAGARIDGPVLIGRNCKIGHGALIRGGTIISDNCVIGHGCEIKNSLLFPGAKVQSLTFVGDSIIGAGARVGSGTITANRRFDQKEISVKIKDNRYSIGMEFFGLVLGDYARLGANVSTLPGTFIGPYTWVMPSMSISGFIPRSKMVSLENNVSTKDKADLVLHK